MAQIETQQSQRAQVRFVRACMQAPLLTREREFELARAWRDDRDEAALQELIGSYTRLVISLANRFRHYGLATSDLVQEGTIGLLHAADRFDPDREVRFSTYASWWIRSSIQDYILRNWSIVRTGTTAAQKSLFFNLRRLRARIEESTGRTLDADGRRNIAELLSVNESDVESMELRMAGADQSLNAPLGGESDEELITFLTDERPDPEQSAIRSSDGASRSRWIREAVDLLSDREKLIIQARRLEEDSVTLEELGRVLGVSKERVRQLESRALGKLKASIEQRIERPGDVLLDA
ncbi:MAG: RNA polymerase factor sigma-32 [Kiloniellales bacterium]|nr:RNA polymerase factor sigma-32 [Kiloniellales bacterium]